MEDKLIIDKGIYNNIDVMENTLDSFKEAFDNNYSVKSKVQYLSDGSFVLLEDDAIERLLNLKDNIKNINLDEIEYISKYDVLKIDTIFDILDDNMIILEVSKFSKKICKLLLKKIKNYQENIIILSMNIGVLKFFKKNGFKVMLKITRRNKVKVNSCFKPDLYCVDNGLMDRKRIKKLREEFSVIANNVKSSEIKYALEIYNNVIIND